MKSSAHRLGRVVVPKPIRDKRLRRDETLDVEECDGVIELDPAPTAVQVVDTPQGPVAEPLEELPALTDELVRDALEQVRR